MPDADYWFDLHASRVRKPAEPRPMTVVVLSPRSPLAHASAVAAGSTRRCRSSLRPLEVANA